MTLLFTLWPLDIASGPLFLLVYAILCACSLALGFAASRTLARRLDRHPVLDPQSVSSYRISAAPRASLTIGALPQREDVWAIAHVRDMRSGLSRALIVAGLAGGWLCPSEDKGAYVAPRPPTGDPLLESFRARLGPVGHTTTAEDARIAASAVADKARPDLERRLVEVGFVAAAPRWQTTWPIVASSALVLLLGVLRCARATLLHRPYAFLVVMMVALAFLTWRLARSLAHRPREAAHAYLRWLDSVTGSLRAGLQRGEPVSAHDAALCVTLSGYAAFEAAPAFFGGQVLVLGDSSGGSGGSCGGGGGCGGGGCGGGGCGG